MADRTRDQAGIGNKRKNLASAPRLSQPSSILVTSGGVFLLPALGVISHDFALMAFAVSIIFLCGYVFAAFGHYELYRPHKESRKPFPFQEKVPVAITIITVVYLVHQWFLFPPT